MTTNTTTRKERIAKTMEKFVNKETGEVVLVLGVFITSKGGKVAQCLCDARLHQWDKKGTIAGTSISLPIPYDRIVPFESIDWDAIAAECYPEGGLERQIERMRQAKLQSLECSAIAIYNDELNSLMKDGMPEDLATTIAEKKKQEFINEKMKSRIKTNTENRRASKW